MTADTIYALSSGRPPAAIAVVRISGPGADAAVLALGAKLPTARVATLAVLKDPGTNAPLDRALILRFPGPASATGEDVAELHLHGGRAVVGAVMGALSAVGGLREAEPGEFTRRAFERGRIDLAEAEGLADLLSAETEAQRRAAFDLAGGTLSRLIGAWQERVLALAAQIEVLIDFSDEGEVGEGLPDRWAGAVEALRAEMAAALGRPPTERLRDGLRVVIAGPPNSGKSSLLNRLAGRDAAITSAVAGTTRDLVEAPTAIGGIPFLLIDTAGLREAADEVESIGIDRAHQSLAAADLILWLGCPGDGPAPGRTLLVQSKIDLGGTRDARADAHVSAETGEGIDALVSLIIARSRLLLPGEGEVALNTRHRNAVAEAAEALASAVDTDDLILRGEALRLAQGALGRVTGRGGTEDMLDALFGRFCVGK